MFPQQVSARAHGQDPVGVPDEEPGGQLWRSLTPERGGHVDQLPVLHAAYGRDVGQGEVLRGIVDEGVRLAEGVVPVRAPAIMLRFFDQVCADGIEILVAHDGEEVATILDDRGAGTVAEDPAGAVFTAVDEGGEGAEGLLHEAGQVFGGGGEEGQVEVVVHEGVVVDTDEEARLEGEQQLVEEIFHLRTAEEEGAVVGSDGEVDEATAVAEDGLSRGPGHGENEGSKVHAEQCGSV